MQEKISYEKFLFFLEKLNTKKKNTKNNLNKIFSFEIKIKFQKKNDFEINVIF